MADGKEKNVSPQSTAKDGEKRCKICHIIFPDVNTYVEHLESKEHTKGIMKQKYGEKYLEAKANLTSEAPKEENNVSSSDDNKSSDEEDDVYTCDICKKICTGALNFKLHLAGNKHRRMVKKQQLLKKMQDDNLIPELNDKPKGDSLIDNFFTETNYASSDILCKVCNKKCTGPEAFRQHNKSAAHKKKEKMQGLVKDLEDKGVVKHDSGEEGATKPYARCETCDKSFSGPLNFKQHMESIVHSKQSQHIQELNKIKDLVTSSDENSKVTCKECGKTFSGPKPFNDHLMSSHHGKIKKKTDIIEDLEKKHPEMIRVIDVPSDSEDSDEDSIIGCDICHVVFTGPESAKDHFGSQKHKKALKEKRKFDKFKALHKSSKAPKSEAVSNKNVGTKPKVVATTKPDAAKKDVGKPQKADMNNKKSSDSDDDFDIIA